MRRSFCTTASEETAVVPRRTFNPVNPATGQSLPAMFEAATVDDVAEAARKAAMAYPLFRSEPLDVRAQFLETIADEIEALGDTLLAACHEETALPMQRLSGERHRTT